MHDELIARLEAATGPCRELDAAIMAVFYVRDKRDIGVREGWQDEDYDNCLPVKSEVWVDRSTDKWVSTHAFKFTASIDAALTLVPEGYFPVIDFVFNRAWIRTADGKDHPNIAQCNKPQATPALAICIAALRAQANREGEG